MMESGEKINLYDLDYGELTALVADLGEPSFRAQQLWTWMYRHFAADFHEMTTLPKSLREKLSGMATLSVLNPIDEVHSADGQTTKLLFELPDGQLLETVRMDYERRHTLCISTQAGCAMGCVFCATGQMGFFRHLTTGEIVAQVIYFARELAAEDSRVTNVVMMGMGEPLHNYDDTMEAIDRLTDDEGYNLGARRITVSTVGLVPAIRRFADEERQVGLAVSLHAATDEERNKLIPVNRRWDIGELLQAIRYYVYKTGRQATIEWALIDGENDTVEQATLLGKRLEGMLVHVNLIPLNPTEGYSGSPSSRARVEAFQRELARYGISSTVRVRRGIDIQAGCGQLRDRAVAERAIEGQKSPEG